jgi:hypothetical protein
MVGDGMKMMTAWREDGGMRALQANAEETKWWRREARK